MIIERLEEVKKINEINKWILLFGRRKTGKTFLINNFIKYHEYFFVKSDKSIITKENKILSYETFLEISRRALDENKTIIVDEFHRLGKDFFDFLHNIQKKGKLILISSTLFLSKKILSEKSALLGLFAEIPLKIISLKDSLKALKNTNFSEKEKLELAILLREPISVDYFNEKLNAREIISNIISSSIKTIPALVGEIFIEEEREISAVYEGVLRAIAKGNINSGEISSYLFSKKLIKKDDPSTIQQYLSNLIAFGIIKRISIFNKKRFAYKIISPLSRIFYYSDEKYNISERETTKEEIFRILEEIMPRIVEDNIREFLCEKYGLEETIIESQDFEVDGYLLKFKKPEIALEVKWGKIDNRILFRVEEKLKKLEAKRKVLFLAKKKDIDSELELMDVNDLLDKI